MTLRPYIELARPRQWVKNLLVFAPLFFAGSILDAELLFRSIIAFVVFCLAASGVYILNDVTDVVADKQHPQKQFRPLARGAISKREALIFAGFLGVITAVLIVIEPMLFLPIIFYLILNAFYSLWLKHIAIVDIVCVALFYLLRIAVGGAAVGVPLSPWIVLTAFFGSLFVITGKRRGEFRHDTRRAVLETYSREALDYMLFAFAALALTSYSIWSVVGHDSELLFYSTIFVMLALFRMLNRMYTHPEDAETPELLVFKDTWILGSFIAWVGYIFLAFYFF